MVTSSKTDSLIVTVVRVGKHTAHQVRGAENGEKNKKLMAYGHSEINCGHYGIVSYFKFLTFLAFEK